jgi:hypothetical protein
MMLGYQKNGITYSLDIPKETSLKEIYDAKVVELKYRVINDLRRGK